MSSIGRSTETVPGGAIGRFEWEKLLREARLGLAQTAVGLAMATYANGSDGTRVRPGLKSLAEHIGASEGAVRKAKAGLVRAGWLTLVRLGDRRGHEPDEFRLSTPPPGDEGGSLTRWEGVPQEMREGLPGDDPPPVTRWGQSVQIPDQIPPQSPPQVSASSHTDRFTDPEARRLKAESDELETRGYSERSMELYQLAVDAQDRADLSMVPSFN